MSTGNQSRTRTAATGTGLAPEAACRTARAVLKTADEAGDDPTVDLMTQRLNIHEKTAWMLRSLLQ